MTCVKKAVKLYAVLGAIGILAIAFTILFPNATICLFKRITELPCPSCGITTAYMSLLQGDIVLAFKSHHLFWTIPFIPIIFASKDKYIYIFFTIYILDWILRILN